MGFLSPASGLNTPAPLNPQQQAQYAAAALALTQQAMNPQAPQANSAPTAPSGSGNQQIPTFQGPTVNVPPQQQPPAQAQSSAFAGSGVPLPGQGNAAPPGVPSIPSPTQRDVSTPSTAQAAQVIQDYPDAPGVQSAMMSLQSDHPTYHQPQYKPPNKWAELGAALLGLAFSSAPIGKFAAGFSGGLEQGAEDSYKRAQTNAQDQYSSELNQQLADEKQAGLAVTYADTEARIKATEAQNAIRNRIAEERVGLTRQRLGEYIKHTNFSDKLAGARLRQQYSLAEQRFAVTLHGQELTAGTRVMGIQAEMARTAFIQMATDRRFSSNLTVRETAQQLTSLGKQYTESMVNLRSPKNTMSSDDKNKQAEALTKQYNEAVQAAIGNAAASAPGSDVDKLSNLMQGMNAQDLQDDANELNAETGGALGGQSYDMGGGQGQPITINVSPGGGPSSDGGSNLPWWNTKIDAQHEPPPQKGPGVPTGGGQPGTPMGEAPPGPEGHAERLAQQTAGYTQGLETLAAGAKLGSGAGIAEQPFGQFRETAAQHAGDYPTAQSFLQAISANPIAAQMSKTQAAQLLETWAHTRRGQGKPVDIPPPPGQTPPQAPAPAPAAASGPGGLDVTSPTLGLPAHTAGQQHASTGQSALPAAATAMATPTKGEVVTMAAQREKIPVQLLAAIIQNESSGNNAAVSPAGARGMGQLMPGTAKDLGVDPNDPVQNIAGTARYLRGLLDRFHSITMATAAYNSGPGAVVKYRGIPPFPETRAYVQKVLSTYRSLLATSTAAGNF